MTAPLTPALALAYLHELSTDLRAAVVLDAADVPLAGDGQLAPRAGELLASPAGPVAGSAPPAPGVHLSYASDGALLAARAENGVAIAVLAGPCALLPLLAHDVATTVQATVAGAVPDA